jgi:hypothetical protein
MLRKIVDVLKEVFWIKTPTARRAAGSSRKRSKSSLKKTVKKTSVKKKIVKKAVKEASKPVKATAKPNKLPAAKKQAKNVAKVIDPSLVQVGEITHYFDRIKVCVVKLTQGSILIGDKLSIIGDKTKFVQKVWSMQIESEDVKVAKKGQIIGLKVDKLVAVGDKVYK